jgi:Domain of Unknown Function with PDB structure (DUF3857)/Transglutaminase-like superfamily
MKLFTFFGGLLIAQIAYGQMSDLAGVGNVKSNELSMTVYAPDSSAEAVVLEDHGATDMRRDYSKGSYYITYKRYTRIKILKKAGLNYANVKIPIYNFSHDSREHVTDIAGRTYNGNEFQDMNTDAIFIEKRSDKLSYQKFTLPNVREGSIIEYTYTIESGLLFELRDWHFQHDIPTVESNYELFLLPGFSYRILFQSDRKLDTDEHSQVGDGIKYRWGLKNVEALRSEAYITTLEDYRAKVYFELISTSLNGMLINYTKNWKDLDKTLLIDAGFGRAINKTGFLKDSIAAIKQKIPTTDTLGRITAVHRFVRQNMNYNGRETFMVEKNLEDAFLKRSGSVAEINLLLVAMLRELDLPANPVLLSTRSNGKISKIYPLLSKFDYVLAHINLNGKDLLLDATDKFRKMDLIPFECLNEDGRLIAKNARWIPLKSTEKYSQVQLVTAQMLPNGQCKTNITQSFAGFTAADIRKKIFETGIDKYKEHFVAKNPEWQVSNLKFENIENTEEALQLTFEALVGDEKEADRVYFNPMFLRHILSNPFKTAERYFPIDFGVGQEQIYVGTFTIPDGYAVEETPKDLSLVLPNKAGSFRYLTQITKGEIKTSVRFSINKTFFEPKDYSQIKAFYDQIVSKETELVVLKKK